ncbi:hypothetical protein MSG28_010446 [Choristoneura fumiferana]|uniref:Uncharacterized protein n=1 Tax=Choristoneura fumiferana TaxID=7141 RepID=A0ACC0KLD3_CHOFU|nr:hypothetical protein MSG28_010446 [Choristoneura fumiferana]
MKYKVPAKSVSDTPKIGFRSHYKKKTRIFVAFREVAKRSQRKTSVGLHGQHYAELGPLREFRGECAARSPRARNDFPASAQRVTISLPARKDFPASAQRVTISLPARKDFPASAQRVTISLPARKDFPASAQRVTISLPARKDFPASAQRVTISLPARKDFPASAQRVTISLPARKDFPASAQRFRRDRATISLRALSYNNNNVICIPSPMLSILLAVLMVSPKRQYLGMVVPTTPATHGPVLMPARILKGSPGQWGTVAPSKLLIRDKDIVKRFSWNCLLRSQTLQHRHRQHPGQQEGANEQADRLMVSDYRRPWTPAIPEESQVHQILK